MKKIVWLGLLAGLLTLLVGTGITYLMNFLSPSLAAEYQNTALFRAWDDPLMSLFFAYPFVLCLALAWFWHKVKKVLTDGKIRDFVLIYFFIATVPGMLISYSSFQVSLAMTLLWTVSGLINVFVAALVFKKFDK
ncbi:MAG: hypothetical protein PHU71_02875 [Candidatus Gracilibacteria bacterium]|nr:hypothetical protein [Candidatus Gracilibacteria bacterium]